MLGPHGVQSHITSALEHLLPAMKPGHDEQYQHLVDILRTLSSMMDHQWLASTMKPAIVCVLLDVIRYCLDPT